MSKDSIGLGASFDLVSFNPARLSESADRLEALACMVHHIIGAALEKLGKDGECRLSEEANELLESMQDEAEAVGWLSSIYHRRALSLVDETASRKGGKCCCRKKASWERPRDAKGHFMPLPKKAGGKRRK